MECANKEEIIGSGIQIIDNREEKLKRLLNMGKAIRNVFKIDTLSLVECTDGYYLYDTVLGMNIAMRAKTEQDAYIQALLYYQRRLSEVKSDYKELNDKVENFLSQFDRQDD